MSNIKIGWASRILTDNGPVDMPGQAHERISQGVIDDITSTALVLDDGRDSVIFLSVDLGGFRYGLVDLIRQKAKAIDPEIPVEKIVPGATHTHSSLSYWDDDFPFTAGDEKMEVNIDIVSPSKTRDRITTAMAEMVAEAWANRCEGGVGYGYGYAVAAHSRRVCYFDDVSKRPGQGNGLNTYAVNGHSVMYGNTNDDNFSHYEAGADHFINLFYTFDKSGRLTGAIVNVPCPSQNTEHSDGLTADYWADVRKAIRAKHGDIFILPQCAAAGDLSPRVLHYKKAQERRFRLKYDMDSLTKLADPIELCARMDIAERISEAFDEVLSWAKTDIHTEMPIAHDVSTIDLPRRMITEEEYEFCKAGYAESLKAQFHTGGDPMADFKANTTICSNRRRFMNILKRYEIQKEDPTIPMELHVLHVGDIAFASNRFELYMDFQHRMQARSPFEQTFIIQMAGQPGDEGGTYLCTERGYEGKGYSASMFCNQVSYEGGQVIVEETVRRLKELYNK